jgi:excisionase family DNA binding protein
MSLLTIPEAAQQLRRNETSTRRLCSSGQLRAVKDGRQWLIDPEDIADYLDAKANRRRRRKRAA